MSKPSQKITRPLVGRFLDWEEGHQPYRYLKLATANGLQVVKVSRGLRSQIQDWQPGIWVTLMIQERKNPATGEIKIKVKQLLAPPSMNNPEYPSHSLLSAQVKSKVKQLLTPPSVEDTEELPNSLISTIEIDADPKQHQTQIRVCQGSSCRRRGSEGICRSMQAYFDQRDLTDQVEIKSVKCLHQCKAAPHAIVISPATDLLPGKQHYRQLQHYQVKAILDQHFPPISPLTPIGANLIEKISNYLKQQLVLTSDSL